MQTEGGRLLKREARGRGLEGRGKLAGESGESRQDPSCHIRTNTQFDPLTGGGGVRLAGCSEPFPRPTSTATPTPAAPFAWDLDRAAPYMEFHPE